MAHTIDLTGDQEDFQRRLEEEENQLHLLKENSLDELAREVDLPPLSDPDVSQFVCNMANHFVDDVVSFALKLCKHRNGTSLEPSDVLLALKLRYDMEVP